ncbi:MAG TPA: MerR family transcriptional regulator [Polyangiaceae bacterium]|nr:MerR family transcriptional regulator [Polyangiaceae bacterium]
MDEDDELPVKLYYRIGEVSDLVGVEPHVLRYWETEFRSIRPQKSRKGQRIYSRRDVDRLLKVKDLLYTHGFTIAGARRRLRETGLEPPTQAEVRVADRTRVMLGDLRRDVESMLAEIDLLAPVARSR